MRSPMRLPFVFSLPHSSDRIPDPIRSSIALSSREIWESADVGTEEIFGSLPAFQTVRARWCRLVVDLNRGTHQRGRRGVVPRVDYRGRSVYRDGMAPGGAELDRRITRYYSPYHTTLQESLSEKGICGLFDCHSLFGTGPAEAPDPGRSRSDIILGNNGDGSGNPVPSLGTVTCPPKILRMMKEAFERNGFSVSLNYPYAGGFITTHYGKMLTAANCFTVQIEINQDLYVDPVRQQLLPPKVERTKAGVFQSLDQIAEKL